MNIRGSTLRSPFGVRNVKVYWDEIPFTDPGGNTYLNQLSYYNFNSIEIIKGPGGSLYGAGTGGVILINGMPAKWSTGADANYVAGSFGLSSLNVQVKAGNENHRNLIGYTHQTSDGYRDHTAMRRDIANWQTQIRANERQTLSASVLYGDLYYQTPYSYYKIKFQYRFTGNQTPGGATWNVRNSGVMVHSQSAKSVNIGQDFPVSVEVQLLGGLGNGERSTGNVCTPGTQVYMNGSLRTDHCISSSSKTYNGDQWVSMEVVVLGDSIIQHIVEGDTVLTYEKTEIGGGFVGPGYSWTQSHITDSAYWLAKDKTPLKEGYIALQAESHPIDFRKIELLNLVGCMDPKAKNYKDYYMKADNSLCSY
jgi:outer membrane receptor protein involved in Fe transport